MRVLISLCAFILFIVTLSGSVHALVPPMSEQELEQLADLIVEGDVVKVDAHGEPYDDSCYTWQDHNATLAVTKVLKGNEPSKKVTVRYNTMVKNNADCVGGRTSYAMAAGERYKLYLRKSKAAHYEFINWAGVEKQDGDAPASSASPANSTTPGAPAVSAAASAAPAPSASTVPSAMPDPSVPAAPKANGACACGLVSQGPRSGGLAVVGLALLGFGLRRRGA